MNAEVIAQLLARAMLDREFADQLATAPESAAENLGLPITDEDLQAIASLPADSVRSLADIRDRLQSPADRVGSKGLDELAAFLDQQQNQQQTGSKALDELAAFLDQQQNQQQGGLTRLKDLAAFLDQQQNQQQTGSKALDELAAFLDQQQNQQQGGLTRLKDLASLLEQPAGGGLERLGGLKAPQTGSKGLDELAAFLDQQQNQQQTGSKALDELAAFGSAADSSSADRE